MIFYLYRKENIIRNFYNKKRFDVNRDRLCFWVLMQGGINYKMEYMKGELDILREESIGVFLINKNGTGLTLDELTIRAINDGFLFKEQSINDFLNALLEDLQSANGRTQAKYSRYREITYKEWRISA